MHAINESIVEDAALTWLGELGYAVRHGPQIAPGEAAAVKRDSLGEVVQARVARAAIRRLNPAMPEEASHFYFRTYCRIPRKKALP